MSAGEKRWRRMAIYVRVSKKEQTVEQQLDAMKSWLSRADRHVVFSEKMSSRKRRPEKERLLAEVRRGEFDAVLVWKLDRFARDIEELVSWRNEAMRLCVDVLSFTETIDTSTPSGKFQFSVLAAVAEYERDVIQQRIKLKLDYKRSGEDATFDEVKGRKLVHALSVRKLAEELGVSRTTAHRFRKRVEAEEKKARFVAERDESLSPSSARDAPKVLRP